MKAVKSPSNEGEQLSNQELGKKTNEVILHHLSAFQANDLNEVMSDYSERSILITQEKTYYGLEQIRAFISALIQSFPTGKSSIELDTLTTEKELGYIVWHAKTPTLAVDFGTDTFIIKEGKILQQTFAGQIRPI